MGAAGQPAAPSSLGGLLAGIKYGCHGVGFCSGRGSPAHTHKHSPHRPAPAGLPEYTSPRLHRSPASSFDASHFPPQTTAPQTARHCQAQKQPARRGHSPAPKPPPLPRWWQRQADEYDPPAQTAQCRLAPRQSATSPDRCFRAACNDVQRNDWWVV